MSGKPEESTHGHQKTTYHSLSSIDDCSLGASSITIESVHNSNRDGEETALRYPTFVKVHGASILEVDFDGLATLVGRCNSPNPDESKNEVLLQIVDFLASKGVPSEITGDFNILVCGRIPIEVQRGREVADLDDLLVRMMWDCQVYGCVIAVAYGVSDPILAIELDDVVSALFDERETPVAVILC